MHAFALLAILAGAPAQEMCVEKIDRRHVPPEGDEARKVRWLARKLGARGDKIKDPCVDTRTNRRCVCEGTALEPFFRALDDSLAGDDKARVAVFGNSLIASDGIVNVLRDRLVERFGDGGRGYLLPDRQADYGFRRRTADAAQGWTVESSTLGDAAERGMGISGLRFTAAAGAWSKYSLESASQVELVWSDAAPLTFRFDEGPWNVLSPGDDGAINITHITPPYGAATLELTAEQDGAVVHGLVLENEGSGVVVDSFGVVAAHAGTWLRTDEVIFAEELALRAPSLVVVMTGGNEAKYISWGYTSRRRVEEDFDALFQRVQAAAPRAACLVVGPIESVRGQWAPDTADTGNPDDPFEQLPALTWVINAERRAALERGCAFFDLYAAMGGKGSLRKINDAGLLHDDLTHPRDRALDMLGQLIADALIDAYTSSTPPPRARDVVAGAPAVERDVSLTSTAAPSRRP